MPQQQQRLNMPIVVAVVAVFLGLIWLACWAFFMTSISVEPGHERVIVDKPYLYGHEGIRSEPLKDGRMTVWKSTGSYDVTMTPISKHVAFDDFGSHDNVLLDFETTIQFRVTNSVLLIDKFGTEWYDNNVHRQYAAMVRKAVKTNTMDDMMSNVAAAQKLDDEVTAELVAHIKSIKLPIEIIGVSLGRAKPNKEVLDGINATAAKQQYKKTLVASTEAQKQREEEQIAMARADNAYRNAMQLSPDMFIQLEAIKRYATACEKAGNTCIVDATGSKTHMVLK